jgi:putative phage-type endonuclease
VNTHDVEQRTEAWKRARLGKLTASRIADATARIKSGWGASRDNLMATLVCERLTGQSAEGYTNAAMLWGIDHEPEARSAYEFELGVVVREVGFIDHPTIPMSGASPDGMIGDDGLLELKCPETKGHIEVLLSKKIPEKYIKQIQWQLACTGRQWCDFATYDPRMPQELQLWVLRVMRDDKHIAELEKEARLFLAELDEKVSALRKIGRLEEAA